MGGLWMPSQGAWSWRAFHRAYDHARHDPVSSVMSMSDEKLISVTGACSFCGLDRHETRALIGTPDASARICDQCLGLCCGFLGEEVGDKIPEMSAAEVPTARLAGIIERLLAKKAARPLVPVKEPAKDHDFVCSFCALHSRDVAKLIPAPRVLICESCVAAAVQLVHEEVTAQQ